MTENRTPAEHAPGDALAAHPAPEHAAPADPAPEHPAPAERSTSRRRVLRRVGTAASGLALLGAVAAVAVAGEMTPVAPAEVLDVRTVAVPPSAVERMCPGPPVLATALAGEDLDYDEFDPEGAGTASRVDALALDRADADSAAGTLAGEEEELTLEGTDEARLAGTDGVTGWRTLTAEPSGDRAAFVGGASASRTESGDLRGLFAAPCLVPATTSWLVGGSTETGSSAQLVLTNVGQTPATVQVSAWGSTGALETSAGASVLVAPQAQEVVLLEAVTGADPRVAVRVEADGGQVSAYLQDSELRGLVPAGVSAVVPSAEPAREVRIPGVVLPESGAADPDPARVRLVNPGDTLATVSVVLLGPDGELVVPGAEALAVDPGTVVDVSLAGLPAGTWTLDVRGDAPLVAAAVLTRAGAEGEPLDRAWAPATEPLSSGLVVLPGLADAATLTVANPADTAVDVTLRPVTADGERVADVVVSVPARSTLAQDAAELGEGVVAVELQAGAPVHVAAVLTAQAPDGELVAVLPASEDPHAATTVALSRRIPVLH
ncbi:DUF5719 family protein [Georgenia faecalis]|uniref:DUF5719 family protein n=1 Tax=Georgenia faecalis TaxID=2483799 RepID=A0ABV9DB75_9MICO|nr:DUF5719 family protein [Georgenia faecalis]